MSPTRLLFEGPDIHAVLAHVRGEYGTDVRIVAADKVRSGGIGGFFARERFEVAVEIDLNAAELTPDDGFERSVDGTDQPASGAVDEAARDDFAVVGAAATAEEPMAEMARDLGTLIVSAPGHPPVIEDSPELPPDFLLNLIESVDASEEAQFAPSRAKRGGVAAAPIAAASVAAAPVVLKAKGPLPAKSGGFQSVLDDLVREAEEMAASAVSVDKAPALPAPQSTRAPRTPKAAKPAIAKAAPVAAPARPPEPAVSAAPAAPIAPTEPTASVARPAKAAPTPAPQRRTSPLPRRTASPASRTASPASRTASLPSRGVFLSVGLPAELIPDRRQAVSTYDALLVALSEVARPPQLPATAGEVIAVVGSGPEVLVTAELVVAALGGDRAPIELVANRSAVHADGPLRMCGPGDARRRATRLARRDTPTVVAVDREHDVDGSWTSQVLAALDVSAVCAVVDARTKPRDLEAYVRTLGRVEALAVTGCARTVDPATIFGLGLPIVSVDGRESSTQVWAAMLAGLIEAGSEQ